MEVADCLFIFWMTSSSALQVGTQACFIDIPGGLLSIQ